MQFCMSLVGDVIHFMGGGATKVLSWESHMDNEVMWESILTISLPRRPLAAFNVKILEKVFVFIYGSLSWLGCKAKVEHLTRFWLY